MKIEMAYRNGRVDVFDTMSFTAPSPLGKENALTNFELRFDELGKKGLWLAAHHYDVDPSGTEECPDDETPVARRRRGWRFLLAEASELDELEWVAVDGELALARVLGEMVDVGQLMRSARLWLGTSNRSVAETIVHLFDEVFHRLASRLRYRARCDTAALWLLGRARLPTQSSLPQGITERNRNQQSRRELAGRI